MKVRLLYYGILRDIIGQREASIDVTDGTMAVDVWQSLRARHAALGGYVRPPLTAINDSFVPPDFILRDGDELTFVPPVAGG